MRPKFTTGRRAIVVATVGALAVVALGLGVFGVTRLGADDGRPAAQCARTPKPPAGSGAPADAAPGGATKDREGPARGRAGYSRRVADEGTCRWCGTGQLFGPVHLHTSVAGSGGDLEVATLRTTGMVRRQTTVPLGVWVCRECGHMELFAEAPEVLFQLWSEGER